MELEGTKEDTNDGGQGTTSQAVRPPPIILTSATNLLQLQKSIKGMVKGSFEFRSSKNGTRVLTKEMADFSAIKSFFLSKKFDFYTFFPKSQKPIKAVIRHLPSNTPAEEICEALVELGFDTISVRQMTSIRRSPSQDPEYANLYLYLVTLPRTEKSQDIFKLTGLCHI
jgi:hypothetical protein